MEVLSGYVRLVSEAMIKCPTGGERVYLSSQFQVVVLRRQ